MRKFLTVLVLIMLSTNSVFALDCNFSPKTFISQQIKKSPIKEFVKNYVKVANSYDYDKMTSFYAPNYVNSDGIKRDIYFKLIKNTWNSYPNIKYDFKIKNIDMSETTAVVELEETAIASSLSPDNGVLKSHANTVYYLQKNNNTWQIVSDYIVNEKTSLCFGEAKNAKIELIAPNQVLSDEEYTVTLSVIPPKDSLVIASIGNEKITYPQETAKEVFRKMPNDMILERLFVSNNDNVNEYAVASVGLTKMKIQPDNQVKVEISGLAYAMSRVNVVPINKLIEEKKDDVKDK